ncbi:Uncharacterised protein [Vibrio cholerae]|nr:Uncharacterised protein [Vibrio cholerae]CSI64791.1 Uncharacterised protein [Vibrio cholerae]
MTQYRLLAPLGIISSRNFNHPGLPMSSKMNETGWFSETA